MSIEPSEHLTAAIEQLSDDINGLMQVAEEGALLKQVVDEMRVLRQAIDDLRAEVEWAMRNVLQNGEPKPAPRSIISMPLDPCDPAFASKLNAVIRHDLPADDDEEPNFDDDAESFREDNGYPLDDDKEEADQAESDEKSPDMPLPSALPPSNGTPLPPPLPPSAPPPAPAPPPPAPTPRTTQKQPLATRLYLHRHMADLVRLIGHEEYLAEDFHHMVQPLFEKYGEGIVKAAVDELVRFEHRERQAFVRLKADVAKLAVQIIGRPKSVR